MACSLRRETRVGFIRTQNVCYYLCAIDNYCGISSQAVACMPKLTQILTDTSHIVYGGTLDSRREDSIQMHLFSTTFGCIVCQLSPCSTISACFQWQGVAHYHLPSNAHSITVDCFHQRHVIIPQRPSTRPKLDKNKLNSTKISSPMNTGLVTIEIHLLLSGTCMACTPPQRARTNGERGRDGERGTALTHRCSIIVAWQYIHSCKAIHTYILPTPHSITTTHGFDGNTSVRRAHTKAVSLATLSHITLSVAAAMCSSWADLRVCKWTQFSWL